MPMPWVRVIHIGPVLQKQTQCGFMLWSRVRQMAPLSILIPVTRSAEIQSSIFNFHCPAACNVACLQFVHWANNGSSFYSCWNFSIYKAGICRGAKGFAGSSFNLSEVGENCEVAGYDIWSCYWHPSRVHSIHHLRHFPLLFSDPISWP